AVERRILPVLLPRRGPGNGAVVVHVGDGVGVLVPDRARVDPAIERVVQHGDSRQLLAAGGMGGAAHLARGGCARGRIFARQRGRAALGGGGAAAAAKFVGGVHPPAFG